MDICTPVHLQTIGNGSYLEPQTTSLQFCDAFHVLRARITDFFDCHRTRKSCRSKLERSREFYFITFYYYIDFHLSFDRFVNYEIKNLISKKIHQSMLFFVQTDKLVKNYYFRRYFNFQNFLCLSYDKFHKIEVKISLKIT